MEHALKGCAERGGTVCVIGGPGLGKTTVLEAAVASATGFEVVAARCDPFEAPIPFALCELLEQGLHATSSQVPLQAGIQHPRAPHRLLDAVLARLKEVAPRSLLIAVDDLHHADPASLALISFLARRIANQPVALLITAGEWPAPAVRMCMQLAGQRVAHLERLRPLTRSATRALLETRIGCTQPDDVVEHAQALSGGNPFLLEQVAAMVDRGEIGRGTTGTHSPDVERMVILARFGGLPVAATRYARAASICGSRVRLDLAAELAELGTSDADLAVEALLSTGILRTTGGDWGEFVHPLYRQALHDDIPLPTRRRLHTRAFHILRLRGLDDEASRHVGFADLYGDPTALELLAQAGRQSLIAGDLRSARERLHESVDMAGASASAELLLEYGHVLLARGDVERAIPVLNRALSIADMHARTRSALRRELSRAFLASERPEAHDSQVLKAIASAEASGDRAGAAAARLDRTGISWTNGGIAAAQVALAAARNVALNLDDSRLTRRTAALSAYLSMLSGDHTEVDVAIRAGWDVVADPIAELDELARSDGIVPLAGQALTMADRLTDADALYRTARAATARAGADDAHAVLSAGHADVLLRLGRINEALECGQRALPVPHAYVLAAPRAQALLYMGGGAEGEALLTSAENEATRRSDLLTLLRIWHARGQRLLLEERPDEAAELYARLERTAVTQVGIKEPCLVPWAACAAMAHLRAGRADDLRKVSDWLGEAAKKLPCRWPLIASAVARACLADIDGDHRRADVLMTVALSIDTTGEMALTRIETLLAHGTMLRRAGQWRRARQQLHVALRLADAAGATWLAAHAHSALTRAGGRRRAANPGLTDQEARAARLASLGHSNPEIAKELSISTRTVETHLAHVYAKLGISSRRQLILARLDYPEDTIEAARP